MKIESYTDWHLPHFVNPNIFESLWRKDHFYVKEWEGPPERSWFTYKWTKESRGKEKKAFITAQIHIETSDSGHYIYFVNGRHRIRWLLQTKQEMIPVGIYKENIELAKSLNLLIREVTDDDVFEDS